MQEYQQRVIDEEAALTDKLGKLLDFLSENPAFLELPVEDRNLLLDQRDAMRTYLSVLRRRIKRFA